MSFPSSLSWSDAPNILNGLALLQTAVASVSTLPTSALAVAVVVDSVADTAVARAATAVARVATAVADTASRLVRTSPSSLFFLFPHAGSQNPG